MDREIYYKYFNEKIKPLMYEYENERKKTVCKVILSSILMFVCGIICAYVFILLSLKSNFTLLLLPIVLFLMYVFFIKSIVHIILKGKEFQNKLVQNVLPYFLEPVANFKFWPKNHDIAAFLNSKLFSDFEVREDEMSIFGIYKDTNITICATELKIPPERIVFKGTTIQLELTKSIDNHIIIISKDELKYNNYKQINPHIDEFNKYLYAFSANENVNIITEDFLKALIKIGGAYTAKGFRLSFQGNTILIAMKQRRPFRFGFLFKTLLNPQNYDELIDMFISVFDFVDLLNLRV